MFHSLQVKHFPVHFTLSAPQFVQTCIVADPLPLIPAALRWEGGDRDDPRPWVAGLFLPKLFLKFAMDSEEISSSLGVLLLSEVAKVFDGASRGSGDRRTKEDVNLPKKKISTSRCFERTLSRIIAKKSTRA